jgi:hypothetical protein
VDTHLFHIRRRRQVMRTIHKKKTKLTAATLAMLVGGGVAIAYWTGGGTGAGEAKTAAPTTILKVNQEALPYQLAPGSSAQTLSGTFDNIADVVKAETAPAGLCNASDYTLTGAVMDVNREIPVGLNVGDWTGATIQFNNKADANQDGCKGATVKLAYTISGAGAGRSRGTDRLAATRAPRHRSNRCTARGSAGFSGAVASSCAPSRS